MVAYSCAGSSTPYALASNRADLSKTEPVVRVEMDGLLRRRRVVGEALRRSCEHGLQRIVSRDAGETPREGAERVRRVGQRVDEEPQGLGVDGCLAGRLAARVGEARPCRRQRGLEPGDPTHRGIFTVKY